PTRGEHTNPTQSRRTPDRNPHHPTAAQSEHPTPPKPATAPNQTPTTQPRWHTSTRPTRPPTETRAHDPDVWIVWYRSLPRPYACSRTVGWLVKDARKRKRVRAGMAALSSGGPCAEPDGQDHVPAGFRT